MATTTLTVVVISQVSNNNATTMLLNDMNVFISTGLSGSIARPITAEDLKPFFWISYRTIPKQALEKRVIMLCTDLTIDPCG